MKQSISDNPLVTSFLANVFDKDLVKLAIAKSLPFTELEYLEVFSHLISYKSLKKPLLQKLYEISNTTKVRYLQHQQLNHRTAYFILMEALQNNNIETLALIISHPNLPISFNEKIAQKGSAEIVEILIENQTEIINNPHLIQIISSNQNTNNFIESKIIELNELYLSEESALSTKEDKKTDNQEEAPIPIEQRTLIGEEEDFVIEEFTEEKENKKAEQKTERKPAEDDEAEETTFIEQITNMKIPDKIKLAMTGTARDRMALIRDPNKMVCKAVVESPKINESEIIQIASNKSIDKDIISVLCKKKQWHSNYKIVSSLALNPKTPVKDGMAFVRKLRRKDLKLLTKDRNVSQVIRNFALSVLTSNQ